MISRFHVKAVPPPRPSLPAVERSPLLPILEGLRGRQVTLQVRDRLLSGRLISLDPLTLVGEQGGVTVTLLKEVAAVEY